MVRTILIVLIFFSLFIFCLPNDSAISYSGKTFYVSPSGKNTNPGSKEKPWASPGYGSKKLRPGDTLIIMKGQYILKEYYTDMITPEVSGRPDAWITIKGEERTRPVLKGKGNLLAAIDIGGKSYIKIENLEITSLMDKPYSNGMREGIEAGGSYDVGKGNVSHIVLKNIAIHHIEECGINLAGNCQNIRMENLNIHHCADGGIVSPSAGGGKGWQNVLLIDSYIGYSGYYYNGKEQIAPYDRPDGIGMEESDGPLEIAGCTFEHNRGDGVDSKCKNTYIHHCVIANNSADSLKFWGDKSKAENVLIYGDGDGNPANGPWGSIVVDTLKPGSFEFINVTVDDNVSRGNYPAYFQYDGGAPINVTMRNCIFAHGHSEVYFGNTVTLNADHNLFFREGNPNEPVVHANNRDYLPSELNLLGSGNISADPNFVQRAWGSKGDYHLRTGSPAIDAGSSSGFPPTDLDGKKRPQGKACDMGAYEYVF